MRIINEIILQIVAAMIGLWLAKEFVTGVAFTGTIKDFIYASITLGILNSTIRPILGFITLPLRILTLGLFSLIINMAMVWITIVLFPQLIIPGLTPLFWTTIIVWIFSTMARVGNKESIKK